MSTGAYNIEAKFGLFSLNWLPEESLFVSLCTLRTRVQRFQPSLDNHGIGDWKGCSKNWLELNRSARWVIHIHVSTLIASASCSDPSIPRSHCRYVFQSYAGAQVLTPNHLRNCAFCAFFEWSSFNLYKQEKWHCLSCSLFAWSYCRVIESAYRTESVRASEQHSSAQNLSFASLCPTQVASCWKMAN